MTEDAAREQMVRELAAREVHDERVLDAMRRVPRHRFVPESLRDQAYDNRPQPIGAEQTISQPLMVGIMTELLDLKGGEKVLEVGTGSGYQTALLAELAGDVFSVERHPPLAERARDLLEHLGYRNVHVMVGDGSLGMPDEAPFDRIIVTAAAPSIPQPLIDQLALEGLLVIPVGRADSQTLAVLQKDASGEIHTHNYGQCAFVPLIGEHGWPSR